MNSDAPLVRSNNVIVDSLWPVRTLCVSRIGNAWVVQAAGDFDLDDLNQVRGRFPQHHVTLDGDVITVWPRPREAR